MIERFMPADIPVYNLAREDHRALMLEAMR